MTTKRKLILTTLAKLGTSILDDLTEATRLQRKNLQDNLKASVDEGLVDKIKDDVTGLPAYKVSQKGQKWLANDKSGSAGKAPIPTLPTVAPKSSVTQAGSGEITPAAAHCATLLASETPGKGADVIEPPKPDDAPAAVCSDETGLQIKAHAKWLRDELTDANLKIDELHRLIAAKDGVINALRQLAEPAGYVIMPDYPDMTIHQSIANARLEAEETLEASDRVHVVAIVDTARLAITWSNAA
ncbi:MAG TPA: hypothetical protein PLE35_13465 [Lentisphaeria bacterium]|nr:hypothetical protein [Lentisphaeria bacterium]